MSMSNNMQIDSSSSNKEKFIIKKWSAVTMWKWEGE